MNSQKKITDYGNNREHKFMWYIIS